VNAQKAMAVLATKSISAALEGEPVWAPVWNKNTELHAVSRDTKYGKLLHSQTIVLCCKDKGKPTHVFFYFK
jgi:hypothetical protein